MTFYQLRFIGLSVIICSLILIVIFPGSSAWRADGMWTPILIFEFSETLSEIEGLLSNGPHFIESMNQGNVFDYAFLIVYPLFLGGFSLVCYLKTRKRVFSDLIAISVCVCLADAFENIQLLALTGFIDWVDQESALWFLKWLTWTKWFGISFIFLGLSLYFTDSKWIKVCLQSPIFLCVFAFFNRSTMNEWLAITSGINFIVLTMYCFYSKQKREDVL